LNLYRPINPDRSSYFDSLTECVIGAVFEVSNTLGAGFLEKVYERGSVLCALIGHKPVDDALPLNLGLLKIDEEADG
jgi:PD-(D/E)XK nuclease superfamily